MTNPTVTRNDQDHRYEVRVGDDLAGFADFRIDDGRILFTHTEVFDEHRGDGVGAVLAQEALTDAAARDETIVPLCPYIARYAERHDIPGARIERPE